MFGRNLFIKLTYILYTIVVLHLLATYFSWYWSIWWYDIMMHFLGGFWIGGMAIWFYLRRRNLNIDFASSNNKFKVFAIAIFSVVTIGLLWELFEFSLDTFIIFKTNDILDTISDLVSDIVGAFVFSVYIIQKLKYKNERRK